MQSLFFLFYTIILGLIHFIAIPFLLLLSFKNKYKTSLLKRFFLWRNRPLKENGIWFHSCSFGEAKALKILIEDLPNEKLRFTTTTKTGFDVIKKYSKESRFLPFETLLTNWIRPQKVLIVLEAELWFSLFYLAKKRETKTILVNARISDKSYPKYLKAKWLYKRIFEEIDEVYAQTSKDKERLESLGAKNIQVVGNIKLSQKLEITKKIEKTSPLVICGASTHNGEEKIILEAFRELKKVEPEAMLILAPRHPQRFKRVFDLAQECEYAVTYYTQGMEDITIVDTLGVLVNIYAISDVVVLGGAFKKAGGHNAFEPAYFNTKIISGKHYYNQKDIFNSIDGITTVEIKELKDTLLNYKNLPNSKIVEKSNIEPILKSIKSELNGKSI